MQTLVVAGLFLFALFKIGYCIDCYSCISSDNPDCVDPETHHLDRVRCDQKSLSDTEKFAKSLTPDFGKIFEVHIHEHRVPLNCLKQVTKVQGREIIMRGCQLPKDDRLDVCKKVFEMPQGELIDVKHCSLCDSDGCNGTTGRIAEVLLILAAVLLTIIH
ncbi:PREDICTED: uncharacterized protein LOC108558575 [Nicrophorus vespilloides]|uniref:Uncharacterized protein LOC108558575 n=1 Tax=Nicrophorus vespilloides TaxID=110193 RepID=A0ABM1M8X9_NICVS|nr:PREDICTED: uncharacterized protein LOC108558575 [Nicrophorus vespilloides]